MKRQACITALFLVAAILIVGSTASRTRKPVPIPVDAKSFQPDPPRAAQFDFSKPGQIRQTMEPQEPQSQIINPDLAETAANESAAAATHIVAKMDERGFYRMSDTNPAAAVKLAAQLDPSQRSNGLMENLVQRWADVDLLAAAVWVEQQTTGDEQERLLQRVGFTLAQTEPAQAAEFVVDQIAPGPEQDEAVMMVVNQWGNKNPAAAAAWVQHLPEGPLQERAVNELEGIMDYRQALAQ